MSKSYWKHKEVDEPNANYHKKTRSNKNNRVKNKQKLTNLMAHFYPDEIDDIIDDDEQMIKMKNFKD